MSDGNLAGLGLGDRKASEPVWTIPKGEYLVAATSSAIKQTKNKQGRYAEFSLQVLEGEHKDFKLTARFNIQNVSAKAVEIGLDQLKLFADACGVDDPKDTAQLHNHPVIVKVDLKPGSEAGQFFNEVKGFKSRKDAGPSSPDDKPSFMSQ